MSWQLDNVINNSQYNIQVSYDVYPENQFYLGTPAPRGNAFVIIPGLDANAIVSFIDIGNLPLGPTSETWGVLITYNEQSWVYRYEGSGSMGLTINPDGTLGFSNTVYPLDSTFKTARTLSDCELAIGTVIFDVVCLAIGAVGLRASLSASTVEAIAEAARPAFSLIERSIAIIADGGSSTYDKAKAVFSILSAIYSGECLGAVMSAFLGSLSWYNMILYGATAVGTIVAALATDGAALIAEIVVELSTFGFLVSDSVNAVQKCNIATSH